MNAKGMGEGVYVMCRVFSCAFAVASTRAGRQRGSNP